MSKIQTTNDIREESIEPHMSAETYKFVMSWDHYPEPKTGERQVELRLHTRSPDFSVLNWQDGIPCFPAYGPTVFTQKEPGPGAGFCEGNGYGEKPRPREVKILPKERWQTRSSMAVWKKRAKRNERKERAVIRLATFPTVPRVCVSCRDIMEKKSCKLPEQGMGSLCSTYQKNHKKIITPANREQSPYPGSLRQRLDQFEKRNRPAKIWRVSTLPTFNRNDGKFLRYDTNKAGEPIRVYQDSDPRLVPEIVQS